MSKPFHPGEYHYRPGAYACFNCRRSFKRQSTRLSKYMDKRGKLRLEQKFIEQLPCPTCDGKAYWMGLAFKAPKIQDKAQWKKVELLHKAGIRFHPNHQSLPDKLSEVEEFLSNLPGKSSGEVLLGKINRQKGKRSGRTKQPIRQKRRR